MLWLTGNNFGTAPAGTDSAANVDTNHNGILDSNEYTVSGGRNPVFSFVGNALSPGSTALQTMQTIAIAGGFTGNDPATPNFGKNFSAVTANGNGLANALTAYNQGQLLLSADGSLIGWNNNGGATDVHANTAGAFWGILADHNVPGITLKA